ncbi:MAG: SlyX family protein [Pseudomonadota bacterium]|nr:SlyX family protein [Pseudomonadota bacterium]
MHDESLEQVQSKIAYLERAMAELSDVVFRQHREIQVLEAQLKVVRERLEGAPSEEMRSAEQERPPHY